jgi:hypothetical protein
LAAVRRRVRALSDIGWDLSTYLREEADPALRLEGNRVKAELAQLVGEPR